MTKEDEGECAMPIHVDSTLTTMSEDLFREIAYEVTGVVFRIHNRYGSLFAEKVYKYEIADECRKLGLDRVEVEVKIEVTLDDFQKPYFIDVLIGGGALFELKVV
ncbi:MAG: GxxExxY protein, partial [Candidatus Paceibacterota bacterium]